ncbi:MAG: hypothetical protein M3511_13320, partial [Deinococcota bacterium]|nr:hypothetical protein [Deinococcota bacterium]
TGPRSYSRARRRRALSAYLVFFVSIRIPYKVYLIGSLFELASAVKRGTGLELEVGCRSSRTLYTVTL